MASSGALFTRSEIEEFLIHEAALLDEWRLEKWLELMASDACYLVPPLDAPDADHRDTLFLIADDRRTLASRVRQLLSGTTWAENPRSRTRRLITNVRLLVANADEAHALALPARAIRHLCWAIPARPGARSRWPVVSRAARRARPRNPAPPRQAQLRPLGRAAGELTGPITSKELAPSSAIQLLVHDNNRDRQQQPSMP